MQRIKGRKVDVMAWADPGEIESVALDQLRNISSLPWVFHHVAAMADVHYGKGATVGSVIAMKDAVSPAAVGVDIGCFTGDTAVSLADGRTATLRELDGQSCCVYSCTPSGRVAMSRAVARRTRADARLVRVLLDSGAQVRCTPDHLFMLRDGTYRPADELAPGTSLMPLYTASDKEGYTLVQQNYSGRWQKAHWIAARSGLLGPIPKFPGQRTIIHHKNFDPADNRPENLELLGANDHSSLHRKLVERNEYWHSPDFERRRIAALGAKALTPEGYREYAERGTRNILRYMRERREEFLKAVAGNGARGAPNLRAYNRSERGRAKSRELANQLRTCESCGVEVKSYIGLHNHRRYRHGYNHSVVCVHPLEEREDVYCLAVPEYGNFALAAGVFVHNCGMAAVQTSLTSHDLPDSLHGLRSEIERAIPVGFESHKRPLDRREDRKLWEEFADLTPAVKDLWPCSSPARRRWTTTAGTCSGRSGTRGRIARPCSASTRTSSGASGRRRCSAKPSTAITITSPRRSTSASRSSSRARGPSAPATAISASSPGRWGPGRSSSAAWGIRCPSRAPRTEPAGG
ncbi:MAG: hypothetical protein E6J61_23225 [Deltaproteobacteria bacterium]|nr:MAG: hypothetical protein E6J61_23225 [Deltaproteobacteria bacterium]